MADEDVLLLEQLGVLDQTQDLAEEGDGLLVELLGVADVGGDDLVEGQVLVAPGELGSVLLRSDGELASHGVLCLDDMGVDVVDIQPLLVTRGRHGPALCGGAEDSESRGGSRATSSNDGGGSVAVECSARRGRSRGCIWKSSNVNNQGILLGPLQVTVAAAGARDPLPDGEKGTNKYVVGSG